MTRFADLIRAAGLSLALTAACVGCQSEAPTPAPSIALTPSGTTSPWATPAAESDKRLFNDILQRFLIVEQDAGNWPTVSSGRRRAPSPSLPGTGTSAATPTRS